MLLVSRYLNLLSAVHTCQTLLILVNRLLKLFSRCLHFAANAYISQKMFTFHSKCLHFTADVYISLQLLTIDSSCSHLPIHNWRMEGEIWRQKGQNRQWRDNSGTSGWQHWDECGLQQGYTREITVAQYMWDNRGSTMGHQCDNRDTIEG